jgi:hypothetical protein
VSWRVRERKFIKGYPLEGLFGVISAIHDGRYIMYFGKPMHPSVIRQWSVAQIEAACRGSRLHVAELNPKYREKEVL